jgi:hypothetical protein
MDTLRRKIMTRLVLAIAVVLLLSAVISSPLSAQVSPNSGDQLFMPSVMQQDYVYPAEVTLLKTTYIYGDYGQYLCVDRCLSPYKFEAGAPLLVHSVFSLFFVIPWGYNVSLVGKPDEMDYVSKRTW